MRICHVVGDSAFGGGSKIVLQLAERAIQQGHDVSVVATDPEFVTRLAAAGVRPVRLECIWRPIHPLKDLVGLSRLFRHIRCTRYELVHTHTSKAGVVGRLAAFLARVPRIVHTVHGFAFHEFSSRRSIAVTASIERLVGRMTDRIVIVSETHRDWALELKIAGPRKLVAIPNGIPPFTLPAGFDRTALRRSRGVADDDFLIMAVGRLAEQKGFAYLIDAAAMADTGPTRCHYIIVGDGPLRDELEAAIAARGLQDMFSLLGFRRDIDELYAAADLVIQPSLWEGLSISLLEAMAAHKPIITTSIRSNLEVVGDSEAALLVPAKDAASLARAIEHLINDADARDRFAIHGHLRFRQQYTNERMLSAYMDLYASLAPDGTAGDEL